MTRKLEQTKKMQEINKHNNDDASYQCKEREKFYNKPAMTVFHNHPFFCLRSKCLSYLPSFALVTNWEDSTNESLAVSTSLCAAEGGRAPGTMLSNSFHIFLCPLQKSEGEEWRGGDVVGGADFWAHIIELPALWWNLMQVWVQPAEAQGLSATSLLLVFVKSSCRGQTSVLGKTLWDFCASVQDLCFNTERRLTFAKTGTHSTTVHSSRLNSEVSTSILPSCIAFWPRIGHVEPIGFLKKTGSDYGHLP